MFENGKSKKQPKKNQQARTLKHTKAHYSTQYKEQGKKLQENDSSKKRQQRKEEATKERKRNKRKKKQQTKEKATNNKFKGHYSSLVFF